MLILGSILGITTGAIIGLIPGLNLGIIFYFLYTQQLPPWFLLGFFLFSSVVEGIVSHVTLLSPIAYTSDPAYLKPLAQVIKQGKGIQLIQASITNHCLGLFLTLFIGGVIVFSDYSDILASATNYISLSLIFAIAMWGLIIFRSKNKLLAAFVLLLITIASLVTIDKTNNAMYVLSTALFGIGIGSSYKNKHIPVQDDSFLKSIPFNSSYLILGGLSGYLIGLPTSSMCALAKEDDPIADLANLSFAKAIATGISLIMVMTGTGARDTASTFIDYLNLPFTPLLTLGLIILIGITSFVVIEQWKVFVAVYLNLLRVIPFNLFKLLFLAFNVASILIFTNTISAILLIITGICISQLIKKAELPQELSLVSISLIPILSISNLI